MKLFFQILLGCCLLRLGLAQEVSHVNFTSEQGLPSNTVYDVYQSKDGFVWLATENGVCKFNGYTFKTFKNTRSRSHAVSNISEDELGRIWVNNFFGQILYIENDSMKIFQPWEEKFESGFPRITIRNDSLLIAQNSQAYIFNLNTNAWEFNIKAASQLILNKGEMEIWHRSKEKGQTIFQELLSGKFYDFRGQFNGDQVVFDGQSYLFFDSYSKILLQSNIGQELVRFNEDVSGEIAKARNIKPIFDTYLAFYGIDGLTLFNKKTEERQVLLKGKNVSDVESLKEGGLLVSTLNEGVFYIPNLEANLIKHSEAVFRKLAFIQHSNTVAVGDFSGNIDFFDLSGQFLRRHESDTIREVQAFRYLPEINSLFYESNRLYQFDFDEDVVHRIPNDFPVKDIMYYQEVLLGAGSGGVTVLNKQQTNSNRILLSERMTSVVAYDKKIWAGGQNGLFYFDFSTGNFTRPQIFEALDYTGVYALAVIEDMLFVGTSTQGLFVIKENEIFQHFDRQNGLGSNQISCLFANQNLLWIGTENGVFQLNTDQFLIEKFDVENGLIINDVYDLITVDNKLWVSSNKGIFIVPIEKQVKEKKPRLIIDEILIDGAAIQNSDPIILTPDQKQIDFHFDVAYTLSELGNTSISYRIKELNKNWNKTNLKNATASYLSLSPGQYTFQVYAENQEKIKSAILSSVFTVNSPFYEKAWFIISCTISICAVLAFVVYYRFKLQNEKNQALLLSKSKAQELRISQLTSIRAQINPHFIFNTMTLIQGKVISGLEKEAGKIIQDFSKLMRLVLDYSQDEFIELDTEIEVIEKYLVIEKERSDNQLSYEVFVSPDLEVEMLQVPSLISQPFVENAIKHGLMHKKGSKHLGISFYEEDEFLIINIKDNGIGRKASQSLGQDRYGKHQSFATKAFEERIVLINESYDFGIHIEIEDLYDERKNGVGTSVNIKIPLDNALRK